MTHIYQILCLNNKKNAKMAHLHQQAKLWTITAVSCEADLGFTE